MMLVRGPMSLMSPCVCPQVDERLALDVDARGSGVVINTCGWVEDMGYELILHAAAKLKVDLIVVLGEPTRLPPSLVWELAYGELVFRPMEWNELTKDHLVEAIADFAQRERRFGGLDDSDESVG